MQLHGIWHIYRPRARWRRPAHTARVVLEVDDGTTAVCFNAPVVELRRDAARPAHLARAPVPRATRSRPLCAEAPTSIASLERLHDVPAEHADRRRPARPAGRGRDRQRVQVGDLLGAARPPVDPVGALSDADAAGTSTRPRTAQLYANLGGGRRVTYHGGLAVYGKVRRPCPAVPHADPARVGGRRRPRHVLVPELPAAPVARIRHRGGARPVHSRDLGVAPRASTSLIASQFLGAVRTRRRPGPGSRARRRRARAPRLRTRTS